VAALAAVVAGVVVTVRPYTSGTTARRSADNSAPTSLATVTLGTLTSQDQVSGTLGYSTSYTLLGQAGGVVTRLPKVGEVIRPGHALYWVDEKPVVLLSGRTPFYRALSIGDTGADVRQLNRDLVALGYATRAEINPGSDHFGYETAYALERLQKHFGLTETGDLPQGEVIFEPGAVRIVDLAATLGAQAGPGAPIAHASSTDREVTVALDTSRQGDVKAGDPVAVTLPDGRVTEGVVSSVGTVASSESGAAGGGGSGSGSTINVYVRLLHPRDAAGLDQAPVQVAITTGTAADAFMVPVSALLALASGGYAVEAVQADGTHRLVAVRIGLFDDAGGLVQVSGVGVFAGQRVVVPASS
jgi:hypothetical protein